MSTVLVGKHTDFCENNFDFLITFYLKMKLNQFFNTLLHVVQPGMWKRKR